MKALGLATVIAVAAGVTLAAQQAQVYKAGDEGVTDPVIVSEKKPSYTAAAMRAKVSGSVEMTAVIGVDGKPSDITILRSLDPGLDKNAIEALSEWRFKPATKDGKPVPMLVTIEMTFTLRDRQVYDKTFAQVKAPVLIFETKPAYTAAAMQRKVEGFVEVEGIVGTDGRIRDVKLLTKLDPDLDAQALEAVGTWRFRPATLEGRPVPYRVQIELTFTLRD